MKKSYYVINGENLVAHCDNVTDGSGMVFESTNTILDYMMEKGLSLKDNIVYCVLPKNEPTLILNKESKVKRFKCDYQILYHLDHNELIDEEIHVNYPGTSLANLLMLPHISDHDKKKLVDNVDSLMKSPAAYRSVDVMDYFLRQVGKLIETDEDFNTEYIKKSYYDIKEVLMRTDKDNKYRVKYIIKEKDKELQNLYLKYLIKDDRDGFALAEIFKNTEDHDLMDKVINIMMKNYYLEAIFDLCNTPELNINQMAWLETSLYKKVRIGFPEFILPLGKIMQIKSIHRNFYTTFDYDIIKNVLYTYKDTHRKTIVDFLSIVSLGRMWKNSSDIINFIIENIRKYDDECYHTVDLIGTDNINKSRAESLLGHVLAKKPELEKIALKKMEIYK